MKRVLLLAALLLLVAPAAASACSCVPTGDPQDEIAGADAAAYGKVVERRVVRKRAIGSIVRYRVKVLRDYKDNLGKHFYFRSNDQSASCGVSFARGARFGTLMGRYKGRWSVSLCSLRSRAHLEGGEASASGCAKRSPAGAATAPAT